MAIYVENLRKRFEDVEAVKGISFAVRKGELFGFLGPNGAGKTTIINILTGLARPDEGSIRIGGIDCTCNPKAAQHLIGIVPDESNLYPELTGSENLCFCAALYGIGKKDRQERAGEMLNTFGLAHAAHRKFAGYSKGMKRKLTIAAGIIHKPEILFLDEPTTGIDVAGARQIRKMVANLHEKGTTIFFTTHYIGEAEKLCDKIAFIVSGKIVRIDTVENLVQPLQNRYIVEIASTNFSEDMTQNFLNTFPNLEIQSPGKGLIRVEDSRPIHVGLLVRYLEDQGIEVGEARKIRPSLEDIFIDITGIDVNILSLEKEKTWGTP